MPDVPARPNPPAGTPNALQGVEPDVPEVDFPALGLQPDGSGPHFQTGGPVDQYAIHPQFQFAAREQDFVDIPLSGRFLRRLDFLYVLEVAKVLVALDLGEAGGIAFDRGAVEGPDIPREACTPPVLFILYL